MRCWVIVIAAVLLSGCAAASLHCRDFRLINMRSNGSSAAQSPR